MRKSIHPGVIGSPDRTLFVGPLGGIPLEQQSMEQKDKHDYQDYSFLEY